MNLVSSSSHLFLDHDHRLRLLNFSNDALCLALARHGTGTLFPSPWMNCRCSALNNVEASRLWHSRLPFPCAFQHQLGDTFRTDSAHDSSYPVKISHDLKKISIYWTRIPGRFVTWVSLTLGVDCGPLQLRPATHLARQHQLSGKRTESHDNAKSFPWVASTGIWVTYRPEPAFPAFPHMTRILRSATLIGPMLTLNVHAPLPVLTFSNRLSEDSDIIRVSVSDRFSAQSLHLNYVFGAGQLGFKSCVGKWSCGGYSSHKRSTSQFRDNVTPGTTMTPVAGACLPCFG